MAGVVVVELDDPDVSARASELDQLLRSTAATVVLVAGRLGRETMRAVSDIALLNGCRLLAVMPSEVVAGHEPVVVWQGESPLVQLAAARRTRMQGALKRGLDIAAAALGLIAVAPLMALAAVAIRLDSPGPSLFRHRRVGLGGREFFCLKFRSMRQDAEAMLAADPGLRARHRANGYRLPDAVDPRVTRVGRWLRRLSIDELPQLVNVLRGEMSLVGPRPVVRDELEHYRGSERLFLSVRPGMTGAWAVNGRHAVLYPVRAELELGYVRCWSLAADVRILVATVRAVLSA
jgi:lipopolysaccharide/colanic/teichoic acid biosynthesis glycosyltransferase